MSKYSVVNSIMDKIELEIEKISSEENVLFLESSGLPKAEDMDTLLLQLNENWNIPTNVNIIDSISLKGKIKKYIKKIINKLIHWRLQEVIENQVKFNAYSVRATNLMSNKIKELQDENSFYKVSISRMEDKIAEQEKKIKKCLERLYESRKVVDINYLEFENKFRGTTEQIINYQQEYLKYLVDSKKILDLGCGRGEFVELLSSNGYDVLGVDGNEDMVRYCKSRNLSVIQDDILDYLRKTEDVYDCIFISQVIEHLNMNQLLDLINLCKKRLAPSGLLIMETPNPETLLVSSYTFYLDHTHVRPIPSIVLQYILEKNNFEIVNTLYFHPFDNDEKLLELVSDNHDLNKNFQKLNNVIYGARDYGMIARKIR